MPFVFRSDNVTNDTPCTGVSWGHYRMSGLPNVATGTDSMGSCFAFIYVSRYRSNKMFLMAHVATDDEAQWLVSLNLHRGDENTWFAIVTGTDPGERTTLPRIRSLKDTYNIDDSFIVDNDRSRRGGVLVSPVDEETGRDVVVTSCLGITPNNRDLYRKNNMTGTLRPINELRPMTQSDQAFYASEFEDG